MKGYNSMYYVYSKESIRNRTPICTVDVGADPDAIAYVENNVNSLMNGTDTIYLYNERSAIYHCKLKDDKFLEIYVSKDRHLLMYFSWFVSGMESVVEDLIGEKYKLDSIKIYDKGTDITYLDICTHNNRTFKKFTTDLKKLVEEHWFTVSVYFDIIDDISEELPWNIESISISKVSPEYYRLSEGLGNQIRFTRYLGEDGWKVVL